MNREEPTPTARPIPYNLSSGLNILGKTYGAVSVIEATLATLIAFVALYFPMRLFIENNIGSGLGISLGLSVLCGYRVLSGIEGESVTSYLCGVIRFNRRRHVSFYNPALKRDDKSTQSVNSAPLPRDVVIQTVKKLVSLLPEKQKECVDDRVFDENRMVFRD